MNLTIRRVVWLGLGACLTLGGCSPLATPPPATISPPASATALKDDLGRTIRLPAVPRRIASLTPGTTETLFALGLGDRVVGRDQESNYPEAVLPVPIVGSYTGPFFEPLIAVKPDFVVLQGETWTGGRVSEWEKRTRTSVAVLLARDIRDLAGDIEKLGVWTGAPNAAQRLGAEVRAAALPAPAGAPTAYFEIARQGNWTTGQSTLIHSVLAAGGVRNVAGDLQGYKQFNMEQLLARNPDIYILGEKKPRPEVTLRQLRAHPQLRFLPCVRRGHVIVLPADEIMRPSPRVLRGIATLRRAVARLHLKS